MQRNQNSLVENLEPISLIKNSNISYFDSKTMKKMETFENRREKVKYFLKICQQEMVITPLRKINRFIKRRENLGK